MGKKTSTTKYETLVQLLVLAAVILTPFLASNLKDLELFSVSKTMFITIWFSIKPWLCPPYVYLLINFIIFVIVASSFIRSNTIVFDPTCTDHGQSLTDSFIESSLICQTLGSSDDHLNLHTLEDTVKDGHADVVPESFLYRREVVPETVVDNRELRKSKTFHEGASGHKGRRERYVRILSQQELDRRVETFINKFKKDRNVQKSKSDKGMEFGNVY